MYQYLMLHAFAPYIAFSNHVSKTDTNRNCLKALTHLDNITNPQNDAFSYLLEVKLLVIFAGSVLIIGFATIVAGLCVWHMSGTLLFEPPCEKASFLHMRKQRRRSASR